ncbi:hypothetical protein [Luteolibacter sp. AS25]|uniref:hypothetical protein n=1 Tax=Luteolibacter sp. AS25 TaxID=3135776 RepID=UPI00398A6CE7
MERERKPWWLYLNILGLDAPLVAVVWLFLFAKTWRVNYLPWESYVALGLIAWCLRITAKLLEAAMNGDTESTPLRHKKALVRIAVGTAISALILTVLNFPLSVYFYLLVGGVLVIGYFALSLFITKEENEISYSKHAMGGVCVAYGTAMAAHTYLPTLGVQQMVFSREFICFTVLCLLASAATELWANAAKSGDVNLSAANELSISLPATLLGAVALVFAVQNESQLTRPFFYAILTGAALLQILNRTRRKFDPEMVSFLTSLCLIAPAVIFEAYAVSR